MATATLPGSERSRSALGEAARETGVLWAGVFALGVGFGVLVTSHGFDWWLAPLISAVVFAGSVEFILVGMLAVAAPITAIALTTLLVNSRHLFYGLSFPLHRVETRWGKAYSMFALCDEAYAVLTNRDSDALTSARILWTQLGLHMSWAVGALAGGLVGTQFLGGLDGLEFVLTALFVVLALDAYRDRPDQRTLIAALGCAAVALVVAPDSMLLVAMGLFAATLIMRHRYAKRTRHA
ncbi:AzlC family ABC transporter permease [Aldersonia kunmingensis]|uniref:AzlC family ABC transporter permease n=1 Tax=Aldersonia kunmingensis TaxID=408066 RepID=UPI0008359AF5|nr:AzlC family ABC transporter permease [Aldersonia kunmingensis]